VIHGLIHGDLTDISFWMMNMGCSNSQLVSVLNSEDIGTLNVFNGAAMLPNHVVQAVFQGALTDDVWNQLKLKLQAIGTGSQWVRS
jgi:hypothetical protein